MTRIETFLGLEPEECRYDDARVVLLPVPYDGTTCYRPGARFGPDAIVDASCHVELWDVELGREPWEVGIHLASGVEPSASGPEVVVGQVEQACSGLLRDDKRPFVLGGEHTVTLGALRALCALGDAGPTSMLQVDAHLDLRDSYEGSPYSHACVARRVLDLGVGVVHVGVRTACPEELEVIRRHELRPLWAHELRRSGDWIQQALEQLTSRVYVSVDVDGLDPSIMPGTGTPVPGGLGWYELLELLKAVGEQREIVGCDLVELAPTPGQNASEFTAAQLAYKMIGYFWPTQ
jgi:agmatinase